MNAYESQALFDEWLKCKAAEKAAAERRRDIEDTLIAELGVDCTREGVQTFGALKISPRLDRKIDSAKLQDIAAEAGLESHLSTLFRWSPEINMAAWKAADERITSAFAPAITIKPGRASFSIKE